MAYCAYIELLSKLRDTHSVVKHSIASLLVAMYRSVRGSRSISIDKLGPTVKIWASYPYQFQCNHGHAQVKICTVAKATEVVVGLIVIRADESLFYQPNPPTNTPLVSPLPLLIMPLICSVPTSSMTHFRLSSVYSPNESFATPHNEFLLLPTLTKSY